VKDKIPEIVDFFLFFRVLGAAKPAWLTKLPASVTPLRPQAAGKGCRAGD
jgi:hypothetical protein